MLVSGETDQSVLTKKLTKHYQSERRYMERTSYKNKNENYPNLVQFSRIFDFL